MKIKFTSIVAFALLSATALLQSCSDNDDMYTILPNALVTAKTDTDNTFYLQLDDNTTLLPTNISKSPYGEKEVRALVNYATLDQSSGKYTKAVYVNWIDSIRTKNTIEFVSEEESEEYGSDPVEIIKDWVTIAEDGYLTLRFRTLWGYAGNVHYINLIRNVNPENPYQLELRHDANGDKGGSIRDALVAFSLKDLPDTEGKSVKLKLVWNSFSGEKSAEFDYCSRKSSGEKNIAFSGEEFVTAVR